MTPESIEIANVVDTFPEWARVRMRDSLLRIAETYALTVARTPMARVRESAPVAGGNVVSLQDYRARAG